MGKLIPCSNCGKMIEKKGVRTMCIRCRNLVDKIRIDEKRQSGELKKYQQAYRAKKEGLI